ncbi:MAG: allantoinase AllB [Gaiellaceae bacterium]
MAEFDLVVRGGQVVTRDGVAPADVGVSDGAIAAIGPELAGGVEEISAGGLHVFPGGVDPHVHFDEPGRTHWEGVETGSRSLLAGGLTAFVDMPLNNIPVTVDAPSFGEKLEAIRNVSHTDFGLWGGLVSGNVDRLAEQHELGACGFKAFMCFSAIDEFPQVDDLSLYEGMQTIAELDSILLLHAENADIVGGLGARAKAAGRTEPADFMASRPPISELEAVSRAILFAEETGCATHLVHLSVARAVVMVANAQARGVPVSCETCPHFLLYTEEDMERIGLPLKTAPPVRASAERDALWALIGDRTLRMVTSDHSPGHPDVKQSGFWDSWGGASGAQSTLQLLLEEGHGNRELPLQMIAELSGGSAARRFRLAGKGDLAVGADADLALIDLSWRGEVRLEDLHYQHQYSCYAGLPIRGRIERTLLRGQTVYENGTFPSSPQGCFITPSGERSPV